MSIVKYQALEKVTRQPVTAAEISRILERYPRTGEPYPQNTIYPSSLYETPIADFVLGYYSPQVGVSDWKRDMYTSHGHAAERVIQERLFRAGVLDCPHECFQETSVWCPILKVKGRVDGIILKQPLKWEGSVKQKSTPFDGDEIDRVILEIKETSSYGYGLIKTPSDLPVKFQWAQAIYQHILGIPETCFLYVNRDSMDLKTMFYKASPETTQAAIDKIRKIWYHIENQTIPTPEGDIAFDIEAA